MLINIALDIIGPFIIMFLSFFIHIVKDHTLKNRTPGDSGKFGLLGIPLKGPFLLMTEVTRALWILSSQLWDSFVS